MKFISTVFPNLTIQGNNFVIKFKNGEYNTADKKEIEFLNNLGYKSEKEDVKAETQDTEKEVKHSIPKSWTKEKIEDYAKELNITLDGDMKKSDMIDYIESL